MEKITRKRERQYLVSESDLKRFKIFYQIPKDEVVGWTYSSVVVGNTTELAHRQLTHQEIETLLDESMENGIFMRPNKNANDFLRSYVERINKK